MSRPEPFRYSFVALQNIPYLSGNSSTRDDPYAGGVLGKGQLVWTQDGTEHRPKIVTAFVEELGVVSLDPRWLVPADILRERT